MRILWSIHLYPPVHNCGAELMAHQMNLFLMSKGHEVRVILHQANQHKITKEYSHEGVEVFPPPKNIVDAFMWADVVVSHLDYSRFTTVICDKINKPLIYVKHNNIAYDTMTSCRKDINAVIYNSKWIEAEEKDLYKLPSMVMYPPCDADFYNVNPAPIESEYITLINLNEDKGGKIFSRIAEAMPNKKFLGVKGSYEKQFYSDLPNLTIIENTPDILPVYKKTRILLMLSRYESWGRTATEAMCNGIPVICTPTKGLMENCGTAGLYINEREDLIKLEGQDPIDDEQTFDISRTLQQIRKLDKPNFYKVVSTRCRERAKELNPKKQLAEFEQFLYDLLWGKIKYQG